MSPVIDLLKEAELVHRDDVEVQDKSLWKGIWSLHVPNKNIPSMLGGLCPILDIVWSDIQL